MLKRLLLTAILCFALVAPAAAEGTGIYAGAKFLYNYQTSWGGGIFTSSESQSVLGGGVFAGYNFYTRSDIPVRTEIEYAFRGNLYKDESAAGYSSDAYYNIQTLMVNFYYDFYNDSAFTPYVGGGIGVGFMTGEYDYEAGGNTYSGPMDDTVLAWNAGGGVGYAITEQVTADLGYRYLGLTNSYNRTSSNEFETSTSAHEVSLGLRFNF